VTLTGLVGQATAADPHAEFFEKRIRPVLVEHCYKCHSLESGKDKGGLRVDSHESLVHGGGSGAAVVPGAAEKSCCWPRSNKAMLAPRCHPKAILYRRQ